MLATNLHLNAIFVRLSRQYMQLIRVPLRPPTPKAFAKFFTVRHTAAVATIKHSERAGMQTNTNIGSSQVSQHFSLTLLPGVAFLTYV